MLDEKYIDIAIENSKNYKYLYGAIVVKDKIISRSDDKIGFCIKKYYL